MRVGRPRPRRRRMPHGRRSLAATSAQTARSSPSSSARSDSGRRGGVTLPVHLKLCGRWSCSVSPSTTAPWPSAIATAEQGSPSEAALHDLRPAQHPPATRAPRGRRHRAAACVPRRRARRARPPGGRRALASPGARPGSAGGGPDRPGVAHSLQEVGRCPQELTSTGELSHQIRADSRSPRRRRPRGIDVCGERGQSLVRRRRRSGAQRPQVRVAEPVQRDDLVAVGDRQLGEHPRTDRHDEDRHGNRSPDEESGQQRRRDQISGRPGFSRPSARRSEGRSPPASACRRTPRVPPP